MGTTENSTVEATCARVEKWDSASVAACTSSLWVLRALVEKAKGKDVSENSLLSFRQSAQALNIVLTVRPSEFFCCFPASSSPPGLEARGWLRKAPVRSQRIQVASHRVRRVPTTMGGFWVWIQDYPLIDHACIWGINFS